MRLLFLMSLSFMLSCGDDKHIDHEAEHADHDHAEHQHVHHAAHGGTLLELGNHLANLEIVCDREEGVLTLYVYGPHAENPVRINAESIPVQVKIADHFFDLLLQAQASALSQETVGDSATFQISDERLKTTVPLQLHVPTIEVYGQTFTDTRGTVK